MEIKNRIIKTELIEWKILQFIQQENFKELPDEAMQKLKQSIISNDFIETFKVWQHGSTTYCLDGFHRCKAFRELETEGYKIPVSFPANFIDCKNKEEAAKLVLIYSSIYAKIETDGLLEYLKLNNLDFSVLMDEIDIPGIDLNKLQLDLKAELVDEEKLDDVPEAQKEAISKLGDIFLINGKHRVMCGDSTKEGDVGALMGEIRADMVFTDPPYNVDYEGYTKEKLTIKSDKMADNKYAEFLSAVFKNYRKYVKDGCGFYICHANAWQKLTEEIMNLYGIVMRNQIIWAKNTFAWGMGRYKFQHEPIFYAYIKGKSDAWYGDRKASTLWQVNKPSKSEEHPTMKPIELIDIAINNSSKMQDVVLDLFLGSGSTLIACEQTNRICYGMELDPIYMDVILRRYKNLYSRADIKCLNRSFDYNKLFTVNE